MPRCGQPRFGRRRCTCLLVVFAVLYLGPYQGSQLARELAHHHKHHIMQQAEHDMYEAQASTNVVDVARAGAPPRSPADSGARATDRGLNVAAFGHALDGQPSTPSKQPPAAAPRLPVPPHVTPEPLAPPKMQPKTPRSVSQRAQDAWLEQHTQASGGGLHFADPQGCVAWRNTANCDPNGDREPTHDLQCHRRVPGTVSGYCECEGGRHANPSGCFHKEFTCAAVCGGAQWQLLPAWETIPLTRRAFDKMAAGAGARSVDFSVVYVTHLFARCALDASQRVTTLEMRMFSSPPRLTEIWQRPCVVRCLQIF